MLQNIMEVLEILHLHFLCVGTVSHKLSSLSLYDYDLGSTTHRPHVRDPGVVDHGFQQNMYFLSA